MIKVERLHSAGRCDECSFDAKRSEIIVAHVRVKLCDTCLAELQDVVESHTVGGS